MQSMSGRQQVKPKRTRKPRVAKGPVFKVVKPTAQHKTISQPSHASSEERIVSLMNKQAADNLRQQQTLLGSLVSGIAALIPSTAKATASQMPKVETGLPSVNAELLKSARSYDEAKRRSDYLKRREEQYKTEHGVKPKYTAEGKWILGKTESGATIVQNPFRDYKPLPTSSSSGSESEHSSIYWD